MNEHVAPESGRTPMMAQYLAIKSPMRIIFCSNRMGISTELFFDDAARASQAPTIA